MLCCTSGASSGGSTGRGGCGASCPKGLQEAKDGAPRLILVAAGSADALRFDHANVLREGGEAPLTANGKHVGLYWAKPRNAWGHWDYIDLGVSEKLRPLRVKLDGPYIVWDGGQGEFVFDVSMWQLHEGRHLVAVKACAGNPGGPTRMSKDAAGRDFVVHADGTIGPRTAPHLRLGISNPPTHADARELANAAWNGDLTTVKSLVKKGAEIDGAFSNGHHSALNGAARNGHAEIVKRFRRADSCLWNTAIDGALTFMLGDPQGIDVTPRRALAGSRGGVGHVCHAIESRP